MPITRHHSGAWLYQFDRIIPGAGRQRANRVLPKAWTKAQAAEYDRTESARLYALATGVNKTQHTIDDAVLLYLQQHAPTLKNRRVVEATLARMHPYYSGQALDSLATVARAYASDHAATHAAGSVRNCIAYLRAACRWAWLHHNMGQHDPGTRVVVPRVNNARQVYLTRADMLRTARAMGPGPSRRAVKLMFYTGLRPSELLRACVGSIQLPSGLHTTLSVADSKNGRPHTVPVHPRAWHCIRAGWPLAYRADTISHHAKAALRQVGLGHARLYDLRHSTASELLNDGHSLAVVADMLNHKSIQSSRRYAHRLTSSLAIAAQSIGKSAKKSQPKPEAKAA